MISFMKGVKEKIRRGSLPDLLDGLTKLSLHSNKRSNSIDFFKLPDNVKPPKVVTLKKAKLDTVSVILLEILESLKDEDEEHKQQRRISKRQHRERHNRVKRRRLVNYSDVSISKHRE